MLLARAPSYGEEGIGSEIREPGSILTRFVQTVLENSLLFLNSEKSAGVFMSKMGIGRHGEREAPQLEKG